MQERKMAIILKNSRGMIRYSQGRETLEQGAQFISPVRTTDSTEVSILVSLLNGSNSNNFFSKLFTWKVV